MFLEISTLFLYVLTGLTTTCAVWLSIPFWRTRVPVLMRNVANMTRTAWLSNPGLTGDATWTRLLNDYVMNYKKVYIYDGLTVLSSWFTTLLSMNSLSNSLDLPVSQEATEIKKSIMHTVCASCVTTLMVTTRFLGLGMVSFEKEILEALSGQLGLGRPPPYSPASGNATAEVGDVVTSFITTMVAGLAAGYHSRKTWVEVMGHVIQNWGKTANSSKSLIETIKGIWQEINPDDIALSSFNSLKASADRLTEIFALPNDEFVKTPIQSEIKHLIDVFETRLIKAVDTKDDAVKQIVLRHNGTYSKIMSRQEQLNAIIQYVAQSRRKPVMYNFTGPYGHGKSTLIEKLYDDLSRWMMNERILKTPMRRMIGTGSADDYLPPMGDQEWYQVDEYLLSSEDKWIGVINQIVSDNPALVSSAFVKFTVPRPHFLLTTSNVTLPFKPPATSKNYMRGEVLESWNSRHKFVKFIQPDYDENVDRDRQIRKAEPVLTLKRFVGKEKWVDEPITYDQLLERMKEDWKLYDGKYKAAEAKAASLLAAIPTTTAESDPDTGNPRVLALYGQPGAGKTYVLNNEILPVLKNIRVIKHYKSVPASPDKSATCHIFDDVVALRGEHMKFKEFFDQCRSTDLIILVDNWIPKRKTWFRNPLKWFSKKFTFQFWSWWSECFTYNYVDTSDLPHESLGRRLGLSTTYRHNGKWISPAVAGVDALEVRAECVVPINHDQTVAHPLSYIQDVVLPSLINSTGGLKLGMPEDAVMTPDSWDIEIKLDSAGSAARYLLSPTDQQYVKTNPSLIASFPDYLNYFNLDTNVITSPRELFPSMAAAYRRRPYTAFIWVGTMWIKVVNGTFYSSDTSEIGNVRTFIKDDRFTCQFDDESISIPFIDIHKSSVDFQTSDMRKIRILSQKCDQMRDLTIYKAFIREFTYESYKLELTTRCHQSWATFERKVREHPKFAFLMGGVAVTVAAVAAYRYFYPKGNSNVESYEQQKGQSTSAVRSPVRTITPDTRAESYEQQGAKQTPVTRTPIRATVKLGATATAESVDGLMKRSGLSMEMGSVIEKLSNAMCLCSQSAGTVHGIFIGNNKMLSVSHFINDPNANVQVMTSDKGQVTMWEAKVIAYDPHRDLSMLEIVDKTFPARPDMRKHFPKAKDMKNIYETYHYIPSERILAPAVAVFSSTVSDRSYRDPNIPSWNPTKRLLMTDFMAISKVTKQGDCGTPVLCPQPQFGAKLIVGIHIASTGVGGTTGLVATVSEEDISALLGETSVAELAVEGDRNWKTIDFSFNEDDGHERQGKVNISPEVDALISDDFEPTVHQIPSNPRIEPIGFQKRNYAPSHKRGGKLKLSPLSKHLDHEVLPNLKVPAPVSFNDPIITKEALAAMTKDAGGKPSIGATQLQKIAGPLYDISKETEDRLVADYVSMMKAWPGIEDWRMLNDDEVINGWDHPKYQGLVGPIKMDTSPGFPYKQLFNINSKGDLFQRVEDRWQYADTPGGDYLQHSLSRLVQDARLGKAHFHVVEAHLKVETLPIEKASQGKTRLFLLEAVDQMMFQKKMFGALQAIMMKSRWSRYQHATTGINPYVEFKTLYQRLRATGTYGWDGDYERFDKSTPPWVKRVMRRIFEEMFQWLKWAIKEVCKNLSKAAAKSLFDKFYLFEGSFWASFFDWSSGNGMTNPFGSMINDFYIILASYGAWDKYADATLISRFGKRLMIEDLHDLMAWFTHGDDVAASVHPLVENVFSFKHISEEMATFGMRMTPAHKNEAVYDLKKVEELSFIGREFEFDQTSMNNPHGRLRFSAMTGMLHWTENPTRAQMFSVLDSFAIELRAYPKEEYDRMVDAVSRALKALNWGYIFSSWEQAREGLRLDQMSSYVSQAEMSPPTQTPCESRSRGNKLNTPKLESGNRSTHSYACEQECDIDALTSAGGLEVTSDSSSEGREEFYHGDDVIIFMSKGAEKQRESGVKTDEYQTSTKAARISKPYSFLDVLEKIANGDLASQGVNCTIHGGGEVESTKKEISMDKLNKKNAQNQMAQEYDRQTPFVKACIDIFATEKDNEFRTIPLSAARAACALKTPKSDRFTMAGGVKITAAGMDGHQAYFSKSVLPRALWGTWKCMACCTAPVGFPALISHVTNSHMHLTGVNASLEVGVNNTTETTPKLPQVSRQQTLDSLLATVEMRPKIAEALAHELLKAHLQFAAKVGGDIEEIVVVRASNLPSQAEDVMVGGFRCKRYNGKVYFLGQAIQNIIDLVPTAFDDIWDWVRENNPLCTLFQYSQAIIRDMSTDEIIMPTVPMWMPQRHVNRIPLESVPARAEMAGTIDMMGAEGPVTGTAGATLDPNAGVTANQMSTSESEMNTAGMRPVAAVPGMVTGALTDPSAAICLRASGIPMAIGAATGAQWNVQDQAFGAPSIVYNGGISTTGFPEETPIFDLPLYTFGGNTKNYINQHKYMAGATEFQVRFTGVPNTSGEFLVYDEEDPTQAISVERALARPNVIFSASNGVTIYSFLLEDAMDQLRVRKTSGEDPKTFPCLRAVVMTPLENSFGTDLSLNIKVLSRPGISPLNGPFRVWAPNGTTVTQKPDSINLPMVNYINIDSNRALELESAPFDDSMETTGYRRYLKTGATDLPRGAAGTGIFPTTEGDEPTGFYRTLANCATGNEINLLTANYPPRFVSTSMDNAELRLYETDGRITGWPSGATVTLNNGAAGYVGKPGHVIGNPIETTVYNTGDLRHAVYKYANVEDFEEAWTGAKQVEVRDFAEGALYQPRAFEADDERAIFPSMFIQPAIPSNTTACFAATEHETENGWDSAIEQWRGSDTQDYIGNLNVDGKVIGKVKLHKTSTGRNGISCFMKERYLELEPTKTIIIDKLQPSLVQPAPMNPNFWNTRVVSDREVTQGTLDEWRHRLSQPKRPLKSLPVRRRVRRGVIDDAQVCVVEAGVIAGGVLGGIGQGLGQWGQNQFWGSEFSKNREHEMNMLGMQLGFSREQMAMQKAQHDNALKGDHRANMGSLFGKLALGGIGTGRGQKMQGVAELPSRAGETAMQQHARAAAAGVTAPTPAPRAAKPETLQVNKDESIPAALKRTSNPGINQIAQPQGPAAQTEGAQRPPLGNTTSGAMEQYHPASIMAGAKIDPTQVLSAQAPYTESMKRQ